MLGSYFRKAFAIAVGFVPPIQITQLYLKKINSRNYTPTTTVEDDVADMSILYDYECGGPAVTCGIKMASMNLYNHLKLFDIQMDPTL